MPCTELAWLYSDAVCDTTLPDGFSSCGYKCIAVLTEELAQFRQIVLTVLLSSALSSHAESVMVVGSLVSQ